jgi:hypothetical protein
MGYDGFICHLFDLIQDNKTASEAVISPVWYNPQAVGIGNMTL